MSFFLICLIFTHFSSISCYNSTRCLTKNPLDSIFNQMKGSLFMKKMNFISKIYRSMTSIAFYVTIIHEHFVKSFLYLVLLSLILALPYSIYSGISTYDKTTNGIEIINSEQFPAFKFENGKLELYNDEPYLFSIDENQFLKVIIDRSNTYTFNDLAGYYIGYLITEDNIIYSQVGTTPRSISYNSLLIQSLTKAELVDLIKLYQPITAIGFGILTLFFALLSALFKSLFSYFMVSFFKNIFRIPLSFSQSYKIAIYSMTTSIVVIELLNIIKLVPSQYFFGIFCFINALYIGNIIKHFSSLKTDISI